MIGLPEFTRPRNRHEVLKLVRVVVSYLLLCLGAISFLVPFVWMVTTSLKTPEQTRAFPIEWIPDPVQPLNYLLIFTEAPFARYLWNTIVLTTLGVFGNLLGSSIAAYAFARLRFRGRNLMFGLMIATMMVPGWTTIIPSYLMFSYLDWLDSYLPLLVPGFFAGPFSTFLLRQFFLTIPNELEDAAKIDGAGHLRIFLTIMLPLSKPALIMVGLFSFLGHWNEFFGPLIYLSSQDKFPISLGIMNFAGEHEANYALMMAAACVAMLPCIILFFIAQKWFIQGIVVSGVKG